jgi:hypothetical protein
MRKTLLLKKQLLIEGMSSIGNLIRDPTSVTMKVAEGHLMQGI